MFNIIVEDAWGRAFHECPRCMSPWQELQEDKTPVICCSGPDCMMAVANYSFIMSPGNKSQPAHILFILLGNYMIQWWDDKSQVSTTVDKPTGTNYQSLQFLPYDITEEQIKLYLTFS